MKLIAFDSDVRNITGYELAEIFRLPEYVRRAVSKALLRGNEDEIIFLKEDETIYIIELIADYKDKAEDNFAVSLGFEKG